MLLEVKAVVEDDVGSTDEVLDFDVEVELTVDDTEEELLLEVEDFDVLELVELTELDVELTELDELLVLEDVEDLEVLEELEEMLVEVEDEMVGETEDLDVVDVGVADDETLDAVPTGPEIACNMLFSVV